MAFIRPKYRRLQIKAQIQDEGFQGSTELGGQSVLVGEAGNCHWFPSGASLNCRIVMATPLYLNLAERLSNLIDGGTFPVGSRLPSVRRMSREQRVSVTTVLEAYGQLLDRGRIEVRARSGYFVAPRPLTTAQLPRPIAGPVRPVEVRSSAIFEAVMNAVADPHVVPFGAAVPGDELLPSARLASLTNAAVRRHGSAAFRYTMAPGRRELRTAISRRLLSAGVDAPPEAILTTQGATEAMALALRATTRPGDLVAVESPTFFGILQLIKQLGLKALEVPMDARHGMDVERLEMLASKHPVRACIVQPSYQNPLGSCMPEEAKAKLVRLAELHDFVVIEDDLYGELGHGVGRLPAVAHYDRTGRVLHCGSVTKSIAPGLRVGWLLPGQRMEEIRELKRVQYPANATLSELVVAEFLEGGGFDRHLRRSRTRHAAQCARMREEILDAFPQGTRVNLPAGGFVLWVELPAGFDSETFAVQAFAAGISLVPGTLFSPACRLKHCVRLSCGSELNERARQAIRKLGTIAGRMS